jgi:hypothetical protein
VPVGEGNPGSRTLLRGTARIAHRTFTPHKIADRPYAAQNRFGVHGCGERFMNAKRKLGLKVPTGIASFLRQIVAGFVQCDAIAIGEGAEEQVRSSRIHIACGSEGLFHWGLSN